MRELEDVVRTVLLPYPHPPSSRRGASLAPDSPRTSGLEFSMGQNQRLPGLSHGDSAALGFTTNVSIAGSNRL